MCCNILPNAEQIPDFCSGVDVFTTNGTNIRDKMVASQKFVIIVPEYNGSFPGVLKTFFDGLKFPSTFTDKNCALVGIYDSVDS